MKHRNDPNRRVTNMHRGVTGHDSGLNTQWFKSQVSNFIHPALVLRRFVSVVLVLTPVANLHHSVISGFRHDVDEICALLGYYATSSGDSLPTFQDNASVPSSTVKKPTKKRTF
jgi:hypothetical protein